MIVNLKTVPLNQSSTSHDVAILTRLPAHISSPAQLTCHCRWSKPDSYYLLTLKASGRLTVICQRCLDPFVAEYQNEALLALCPTEGIAERLLVEHETVVYENDEIDLVELITDELHLDSPRTHDSLEDCNGQMRKYYVGGGENRG